MPTVSKHSSVYCLWHDCAREWELVCLLFSYGSCQLSSWTARFEDDISCLTWFHGSGCGRSWWIHEWGMRRSRLSLHKLLISAPTKRIYNLVYIMYILTTYQPRIVHHWDSHPLCCFLLSVISPLNVSVRHFRFPVTQNSYRSNPHQQHILHPSTHHTLQRSKRSISALESTSSALHHDRSPDLTASLHST